MDDQEEEEAVIPEAEWPRNRGEPEAGHVGGGGEQLIESSGERVPVPPEHGPAESERAGEGRSKRPGGCLELASVQGLVRSNSRP